MKILRTKIALTLATMVLFVACSKDEGQTLEQSIVGKWQLEKQYLMTPVDGKDSTLEMQIQYEATLEFKSDGSTLSKTSQYSSTTGSWVLSDSVVNITTFSQTVPYNIIQLDQTQLKLNVHAGGNSRYLFYYVRN